VPFYGYEGGEVALLERSIRAEILHGLSMLAAISSIASW